MQEMQVQAQVMEIPCTQSGQCPGRLEARSEACSALSLRPKQDYLFIFPNNEIDHLGRLNIKKN